MDDDALLNRIVYTVTNPSAANLVSTVEGWAGLCVWRGGVTSLEGSRLRKKNCDRAVAAHRRGRRPGRWTSRPTRRYGEGRFLRIVRLSPTIHSSSGSAPQTP